MIISYSYLKELINSNSFNLSDLEKNLINLGFEIENKYIPIKKDIKTVKATKVEKLLGHDELYKIDLTDNKDCFSVITSWSEIKEKFHDRHLSLSPSTSP